MHRTSKDVLFEKFRTWCMEPLAAPAIFSVSYANLSIQDLFEQANLVVKLVILGLIGASIWSWAIILQKYLAFSRAHNEATAFEKQFWSGQSLDELYGTVSGQRKSSMASIFIAAMREWRRSLEASPRALAGVLPRMERVMDVSIAREMQRLESGLTVLATIGSTAPYIGLFGTVWGIMSSFRAMAASGSTALTVVAPGIAEALFATALGLFAAIPAVIGYNVFSRRAAHHVQRLEAFSEEFAAIVSRQIDTRS
jgi:biopolymer transport protein TolQ